jgi:hypothetical protein
MLCQSYLARIEKFTALSFTWRVNLAWKRRCGRYSEFSRWYGASIMAERENQRMLNPAEIAFEKMGLRQYVLLRLRQDRDLYQVWRTCT